MSFHFVYRFFHCAKAFKFNQVPFFNFYFYFHYSGRWVIEGLGSFTSESVFPMFSSKSFIDLGFTFRSLINSEFIFVHGVRKCSSFILLHGVDHFFCHHMLKRLSYPLYIFACFVKDKVSTGMWIYYWTLYFVPLIYSSVFVPVPCCLDDCSFVV